MTQPIQLIPEYRDYVWGGDKLRPGFIPTAEAWAVYENDRVAAGPWVGFSLAELTAKLGDKLLGKYVQTQTGGRFPLLIKLLDCAQWLSVQVHPNDEQAARLEGLGFFGKTEAWHVLGAEAGAQLIAGVKAGVSSEALAASISDGTILSLSQYVNVNKGETIFIRPGTIHALGPGLLIYEVQQSSDLTYRVYDWGRPQTEKRKLHIEKSLAVSDASATVQPVADPALKDGERKVVAHNSYFKLEVMVAEKRAIELNTAGQSFHAITVTEGQAQILVSGEPGVWKLGQYETLLIPADCGKYSFEPMGACRALKSSVEP
ncbi:MAG: type I phosphomannose isomerase catalytic subunit [Leptolinea sp.]